MDDIQLHSTGAEVVRLQNLLNTRVVPPPKLDVDGRFGPKTRAAVLRFQRANWLRDDGRVGPCTWGALEKREKYVLLHKVILTPQWTDSTCWHAALTMILQRSVSHVPPYVHAPAGIGLLNDSELSGPSNTARFAAAFGLKLVHGQSTVPSALADLMRRHGPLMMDILWNPAGYGAGGSSGHMVVVAGIRGDGTAQGTTLRIYDPWPVNRGSIYSLSYGPFLTKLPTGCYQLFHK